MQEWMSPLAGSVLVVRGEGSVDSDDRPTRSEKRLFNPIVRADRERRERQTAGRGGCGVGGGAR